MIAVHHLHAGTADQLRQLAAAQAGQAPAELPAITGHQPHRLPPAELPFHCPHSHGQQGGALKGEGPFGPRIQMQGALG